MGFLRLPRRRSGGHVENRERREGNRDRAIKKQGDPVRSFKQLCFLCICLFTISVVTTSTALGQETDASAPAETVAVDETVDDTVKLTDDEFANGPYAAHNAWMLTCCALVLFMTAPGLALFYGGLVRRKNVLSVMMQCVFSDGS